jgi:hypothetical protein
MRMIWLKLAFPSRKTWLRRRAVAVSLVLSRLAWAQGAGTPPPPAEPAPLAPPPAAPAEPPPPPAAPAPPAVVAPPLAVPPAALGAPPPVAPPKPSPFTFALKGFVSGSIYLQDTAFLSGQGNGAIFGPADLSTDKLLLGGDVRQTQLKFTVAGPEVLGGATPNAVIEIDMLGGHQVSSVPAPTGAVVVRDSMGNTVGTGAATNGVTSSAQGDESVLPRLRLAYAELNWGGGTHMLRVGQQHNLLILMIPASASHIGVPLGYAAGQLGWRTPAVTYLHKMSVGNDTKLDLHLQINRNSWIDNFPVCGPGMAPPAAGANCLPAGISMGEASGLPQVEGRLILSGGKAPSPWPYYPPNVWMVYLVGHWDQKDLSGVGARAAGSARDTMQTVVGALGAKATLGPFVLAANGWYGKNAGGVYGHVIQMQVPSAPDVSGFGAWGQLGFSASKELSFWAFGGIDKPNEADAKAASLTRLQNVQVAGQVAYKDGPYVLSLELLHVWTKNYVAATDTTTTLEGNQPTLTALYFF